MKFATTMMAVLMGATLSAGPALAKKAFPRPAAISLSKTDAAGLPKGAKFKGTLVNAYTWSDSKGENFLIQSYVKNAKAGSIYLYANHYLKDATGKVKLLRLVDDKVEKCIDADNLAAFLPGVEEATDVDGDGISEISFAYTVECTSDVSPVTLKVLLLEDGAKYIIRGKVLTEGEGKNKSEEKVPDPANSKGSAELRVAIDAKWDQAIKLFSYSNQY